MVAGPSNMAYTEISAVSGCLSSVSDLRRDDPVTSPLGWVLMGSRLRSGAAVGTGHGDLTADDAASRQTWTFFGSEAALASWLILANF